MPDQHPQPDAAATPWFKRAPAIVTITLACVLLGAGTAAAILQATTGGQPPPDPVPADVSPETDPPPDEPESEPEPEPEPEPDPELSQEESALSEEESALLAKLPYATDCVSNADPPTGALTSLACNVEGSPAFYTSFATARDMRAWFDSSVISGVTDLPPGDCQGSWNEEGVWELDGEVKGRMKCYDYGEGYSAIEWMDNHRLIHGVLTSEFGAHEGLYRAWEKAG